MTKTLTTNHLVQARERYESTWLSHGIIYCNNMVKETRDDNKKSSPSPSHLLLPAQPDQPLMRETNAADLSDDCFRDLKPGLWLPISITAPRCGHASFTAQRAPQASPNRAAAAKEMLKAPVAIHPVVTPPPALPADLAAPRLRCPTEPSCAPRSSLSRRLSAIAELRSQRKIQTPPLPLPPKPLPPRPKPLLPSTPRGDSPPGRQRWSSSGPPDRPAPKAKAPPGRKLEPFSPQPPAARSLAFADHLDLGELPRLRLQHRQATRGDDIGVWTSLRVNCLPVCRSVPRLTADQSSSAVSLPQRPSDGGLPGVRQNAAALTAGGDCPAPPGRGSLREKRELLSPAIASPAVKDAARELPARRPPPMVIEPCNQEPPGAAEAGTEAGTEAGAEAGTEAVSPAGKTSGKLLGQQGDANRLSPDDARLADAMKMTQVLPKSSTGEPTAKNGSAVPDLTDGMLVCTPLAGARSVTTLTDSPGAGRTLNGTLSAVSRRTRPFSVVSTVSSKPSKYSIVTDGASEYPDPFSGASPSFQQRLMDLSSQENETIRWEKLRATRRKQRLPNRQD